jgi:large subunit ribosomal protein L20
MARIKHSAASRKRKKRILKLAKGYRGQKSKIFRRAHEAVMKALQYSYRDRRARKRDFRKLWITRINAAARVHGMSYSKLIGGLRKAGVEVNRKMLAELAVNNESSFSELVRIAKAEIEKV